MIQIYAPDNINFDMNGDAVLFPTLCDAQAELGGSWYLDMTHPIDEEGRWKNLVKEAVLSVPTFMGKKQLYRIDETDKQDTEITVKAYPIFFDSADELFLMDKRPTGKNGQEALDIMTEGSKYSGESNISSVNTAYFVRRNFMDCLNGDSPSFTGIWGGEPLYDNYKVIVNERAGGDYGAEVRYGMNMNGISVKEDMSEVVTRIVPVAYNGRTLSTNYVDSPLIQKYAKVYTREIKFEDVKFYEDLMEGEDTTGIFVCNSQEALDAALIAKCNEQFEAGIDVYKVTIDIDMVSIENTEEYKDFTDLVKIGLGDTVGCYNRRLGITTKARAIVLKWDCITDSVKEVTLGDYEYNVLDQWNSTVSKIENIVNSDGTVAAEKIQGILDAISVQLRYQKDAAHKQDVRAILFEDLDPESQLYGALAIGTQGIQISQTRTADGRDWDWTTAATAKGMIADVIITGLISDKLGRNWWNLDTSEFQLASTTAVGDSTVASQQNVADAKDSAYLYADNAVDDFDKALTMQEVFNRLTNNGAIQGIYLKDGQLYINASYVLAGILTGIALNNGNGTFSVDANGNAVANSLSSKNATITGGSLKITSGVYDNIIALNYDGTSWKTITVMRPSSFKVIGQQNDRTIGLALDEGGINGGYFNAVSADATLSDIAFQLNNTTNSLFRKGLAVSTGLTVTGGISADALAVSGLKNRKVNTKNYGERLLNCYETPTPMFGDIGEGQLDDTGKCFVFLDDIFAETIDTDCTYQVFLQPYGKGECYVTERNTNYFVVEGTENLSFGWEVKAVQRDFDTMRLEEYEEPTSDGVAETLSETETYLNSLLYNVENIDLEREDVDYE